MDTATFEELVGESPVTRAELARVAAHRTAEPESKKNGDRQ
jgi:hypothetical protein